MITQLERGDEPWVLDTQGVEGRERQKVDGSGAWGCFPNSVAEQAFVRVQGVCLMTQEFGGRCIRVSMAALGVVSAETWVTFFSLGISVGFLELNLLGK